MEEVAPCAACDICLGETQEYVRTAGSGTGVPEVKPLVPLFAGLSPADEELPGVDAALFERLRSWRGEQAKKQRVPAYVVLHNSHLEEISARKPDTIHELGAIKGVGLRRAARYGDETARPHTTGRRRRTLRPLRRTASESTCRQRKSCSGQGAAPMPCLLWPVLSSSAARRRAARWTTSWFNDRRVKTIRKEISMRLEGKKIAVLVAEGFEDLEYWVTVMRLQEEGAEVVSIGPDTEPVSGKNALGAQADTTADGVDASELDGIVVPGGWAPDKLRRYSEITDLVRTVHERNKTVGIICHGGLVAISAGIVDGVEGHGLAGDQRRPGERRRDLG